MNTRKLSTTAFGETTLKVFFEEPFWVGVFERTEGRKLSVCKVIFGAEPTDAQILRFVLHHFDDLKFSKPVKVSQKKKAYNPKRRSRELRKQLRNVGIGTKSQQILKQQYEEKKLERKRESKAMREEAKERYFLLKKQKKKEKHKGH